jgi:CSLREA domain-containing protein
MGSALRRSHRAWLLKFVVVLATFATGLAMAGVVSGGGFSVLTTDTESTVTDTTTTDTTAEPTEPDPTDPDPTDPDPTEPESTEPESTEPESTEPESTEPEPEPTPNPPCVATGDEALTTDKSGYLPGALAVIAGTGFGASCDAELRITLPDETTSTQTVSTDAGGSFGATYTLPAPAVPGEYLAEAIGALDAVLASTSFEGLEPTSGTPFIWTDRDDYKPGETFVLRGSGWLPGEAIRVVVDDDDGDTWLHTADLVAGADGTFTDLFQLPDWFVAVYTVTATGGFSGVATTSFTDAVAFGGCGPFAGSPPHTITVNTNADEWNDPTAGSTTCSLREAVRTANLDPGADTIVLPANTYQLTRTGSGEDSTVTGDLDVLQPVTISGGGARTTLIQAGSSMANGIDRVFHITSAGALTMSQTTVQFGRINNDGGGIRLESSSGTALSLTDVTVRNNTATATKDGGGISAAASITLNRVTINDNVATQHGGGLHLSGATSSLTNVTVTNNTASQQGGGIRTSAGATTLTNVTVSHNTGATGGGIRRDSGSISLRNTIVSNSTGANCSNGSIGNAGNNLDSGTTCGFGSASGSQSSTSVPPANALLGPLQNNGGPTDTRALGTGSTAIDRGTSTSAPGEDQRSVARPLDGDGVGGAQHDVGAYEAAAAVVTSAPTVSSPICTGATSVSGTSSEADGTSIQVFKNGAPVGTPTTVSGGTWTKSGLAALVSPDQITARATAVGKLTSGDSNTVTVTVCNTAPVANDDAYATNEDTPLIVAAPGVLANDTDADGNALTVAMPRPVSGPTNGSLTLNADGSFQYTPNANFFGSDSFTYKASDGAADSNLATVTITVTPVNDAPVANGDAYTVAEDGTLNVAAPGVLGNDTDVDGDALTVAAPRPVSGPTNGSLTLNADGSFQYTPNANFHGGDSFTYRAGDGTATSNLATVTITVTPVNDAPVANDNTYSVAEDGTLNVAAPGVLGNDTDVDGDALTVASPRPASGPSNGSLTLNADGSFDYTPNANFFGNDSFTYRANDGTANSNLATVTITVTPVNDAPVANHDAYSVAEDGTLTVPAPGVLANDTDVEGSALTVAAPRPASGPTNGSLTLNADGSFQYTPNTNFFGSDSFTYRASDGAADSNLATVTITVTPVNDAPVANDDGYNATEDTALSVNAANGVLNNDSDVDGDPLTAVLGTGPAHAASFTLSADGSFQYTPAANYCGSDSFTYRAKDDSGEANDTSSPATASIEVACVNDPPTVDAGNSVSGAEGLAISLDGTVTDVEGHTFTVVWTYTPGAGVDAGASCSFANANAVDTSITCTDDGTYTATLTATDSQGASGSDSTSVSVSNADPVVTVNSPDENTAPVSVGTAVTVNASFTDAGVNDTHSAPAGGSCQINWGDGNTTTGVVTETPQSGSGSCTGTHAYAALGVYEITVTVTDDDGGSGSDTAQIVVFDPNAGFVTGGGWITVQPGSYTVDPTATGKGNFGFVSKYKNGASTPTGETEFNFNTASFRFHSDSYKFLLVNGFKAQFVGTGSVNGEGGYDFRLTAYDGQVNGGGGVDRFRIKIRKGGATIFDNRFTVASDDMETADPQAIGGGSIVIHKGK